MVCTNRWRQHKKTFALQEKIMVLTVSEEEFVQMKMIVMDRDEGEAFSVLKEFLKRLEQQKNLGLKSHLD
jgi:ArsR family metal-binding transcriptional regulator